MQRWLCKELAKWTRLETKMPNSIVKVDVKKYVCHFALVIKVLMQYFFFKGDPQILTMLEPAKTQQTSTSKGSG